MIRELRQNAIAFSRVLSIYFTNFCIFRIFCIFWNNSSWNLIWICFSYSFFTIISQFSYASLCFVETVFCHYILFNETIDIITYRTIVGSAKVSKIMCLSSSQIVLYTIVLYMPHFLSKFAVFDCDWSHFPQILRHFFPLSCRIFLFIVPSHI